MKKIIFIIILAVVAVGIIAWFQAKPLGEPTISVTNTAKAPADEVQAIDIGNATDGFTDIDANISQL